MKKSYHDVAYAAAATGCDESERASARLWTTC
jgi:hypothetical protein